MTIKSMAVNDRVQWSEFSVQLQRIGRIPKLAFDASEETSTFALSVTTPECKSLEVSMTTLSINVIKSFLGIPIPTDGLQLHNTLKS